MNEGDWYWASNGHPIKTTYFRADQPDNYRDKENCIEMDENQLWNDLDCINDKRYFICE